MSKIIEKWKNIAGFKGYQVSNYGRIKSFKGKSPRILKTGLTEDGYLRIVLPNNNGNKKQLYIHRLVAELFIKNPNKYDIVDHIDHDRGNSFITNLRWVNSSMNSIHGAVPHGKKIIQYDLKGNIIQIHDSVVDAAKKLNKHVRCIERCARGENKTAFGFLWKYCDDKPNEYKKVTMKSLYQL